MYFAESNRVRGIGELPAISGIVSTVKQGVDWIRIALAGFTAFQLFRKKRKARSRNKRRRHV